MLLGGVAKYLSHGKAHHFGGGPPLNSLLFPVSAGPPEAADDDPKQHDDECRHHAWVVSGPDNETDHGLGE